MGHSQCPSLDFNTTARMTSFVPLGVSIINDGFCHYFWPVTPNLTRDTCHMCAPDSDMRSMISERKWEEARKWSKGRANGGKYGMRRTQRPNGAVARGSKRLAGRFHQLRTGHCRTGQYLKWTKNADTAEFGWCRYKTQTRDHLFKNCR